MHPHAKWVMDVKWYLGWKLLIRLLIFDIIGCGCPMRKKHINETTSKANYHPYIIFYTKLYTNLQTTCLSNFNTNFYYKSTYHLISSQVY